MIEKSQYLHQEHDIRRLLTHNMNIHVPSTQSKKPKEIQASLRLLATTNDLQVCPVQTNKCYINKAL
jgi:hypothetical protein